MTYMLQVRDDTKILARASSKLTGYSVVIVIKNNKKISNFYLPVKNLRHAQIVTLAINEYEALLEEHEHA